VNVRDLLLALLQNAIKGKALNVDAVTESLSSKKLATLFKVAKKHDVAHLVAYALEQSGVSLEGEMWQAFLSEKEQAKLRYEMIQADTDEICACFDNEGIDYIPLKGAVVRAYYPQPWMRTSCDIDILVREADLENAVNALTSKCSYSTDFKKTYHDISLYSPFGMHLELHHNIKETIDKYDELLTQVWAFSKKADENRHMYLQSKEFMLFHLSAHMAYHFVNGGCGLRSVLDMWLLSKKLTVDNVKLLALLKRAELDRFYSAVMELGEYWFDDKSTPSNAVLKMEKYILLGGAYGTGKQGAAAKQIKNGGKFKYFWTRVFMPYESLAILYPIIKRHKIMTPFCQIARWFSVIFKGKRIKKEIKEVTAVSKEQVDSTRALLNELGL